MTGHPGDVLLSGATGFLGMELLERYLERGDRRVIALVRAPGPEGARARVDAVSRTCSAHARASTATGSRPWPQT